MTAATLRIVAVLREVPAGRVSTYGAVAAAAGLPRGARQVARLLHSLSRTLNLPWHRIVRSDGTIALGEGAGRELQAALLQEEGVTVLQNRRVDLSRYAYTFSVYSTNKI